MPITPKLSPYENQKDFLIKGLARIANRIGQTLLDFYPDFHRVDRPISILNHRVTNLAPHLAMLGYFIISMAGITAPSIAITGAQ